MLYYRRDNQTCTECVWSKRQLFHWQRGQVAGGESGDGRGLIVQLRVARSWEKRTYRKDWCEGCVQERAGKHKWVTTTGL